MMPKSAQNIAKGLAAAWSSGDPEKVASFFTKDCIFEDVCCGRVYRGKEELKTQAKYVLAAIPGLRLKIETCFSSNRWIGCEWTETGKSNGRRFSVRGASIVELEEGKIKRESMYCHFDGATWLDP